MSLSPTQLSQFARLLDERYATLLEEVRGELEASQNLQYIELIDRVPADVGDQSVGDALADFNLAIVDRHVQEIRDIEAAKRRIEDGGYGVCTDCNDEIDPARLAAYPTAKRCHACQQQGERTYRHEATPRL